MRAKSVFSSIIILALVPLVFAFVNCSNSSDSGAPSDSNTANGGNDPMASLDSLYVGAYQEDSAANPEDPTSGVVYLNLPASGAFSGQMYFTYVGCQSSNVGLISGTRVQNGANDTLNGSWKGTVDGTQQQGAFTGSRNNTAKAITGTYNVAGGKQSISIPNCIDYFIAPHGTFTLSAVGTVTPANLNLKADANGASWTVLDDAAYALVSIVDAQAALANSSQAVLAQEVISGSDSSYAWTGMPLTAGRRYIAVLLVLDSSATVIGRGSVAFVK